jgi:hypothetical protein
MPLTLRPTGLSGKSTGSLWTIEIEVAVTGAAIALRAMVPVGCPENPRQSFPSQTKPSPAGFLLARAENG